MAHYPGHTKKRQRVPTTFTLDPKRVFEQRPARTFPTEEEQRLEIEEAERRLAPGGAPVFDPTIAPTVDETIHPVRGLPAVGTAPVQPVPRGLQPDPVTGPAVPAQHPGTGEPATQVQAQAAEEEAFAKIRREPFGDRESWEEYLADRAGAVTNFRAALRWNSIPRIQAALDTFDPRLLTEEGQKLLTQFQKEANERGDRWVNPAAVGRIMLEKLERHSLPTPAGEARRLVARERG